MGVLVTEARFNDSLRRLSRRPPASTPAALACRGRLAADLYPGATGRRQGEAPMDALYRARTRSYQEFEGKVNRTEQIYYAYPFRLYPL